MNKKNILLIIFLSLFLVPELLWFSSLSIFLSFFDIYHISKETYLDNLSDNMISLILMLQFIGIIGIIIFVSKLKKITTRIKLPMNILSVIFGIIVLFSFLVSISLRNPGF